MTITPTPTPAKPRVQQDEDRMFWFVHYPCCDTRRMRFHDWALALRIAVGHECPPPFETATFRPKRLTRNIR